ncbi:hypothetical protein MMC13_001638, partial [Lambiella insularis]|nr:hypothetical protein [Lambiella insularis]
MTLCFFYSLERIDDDMSQTTSMLELDSVHAQPTLNAEHATASPSNGGQGIESTATTSRATVKGSRANVIILQLTAVSLVTSITTGFINIAIAVMAKDLSIPSQLDC